MKKNILIPSFFALAFMGSFTFCSKEPDVESIKKENQVLNPELVSTNNRNDEDPEGCSSLCQIRINDISHTISVRDYFTIYKEFKPIWFRVSQSWDCGSSTLQIGQWYPITLTQNEQYIFYPEFWTQCDEPSNFCYPISIMVGNNIFNYNVNSRAQFAFTRQGCAIVPGWVE